MQVDEEQCLSLPGLSIAISRPRLVVCEAFSMEGRPVEFTATDYTARVLQVVHSANGFQWLAAAVCSTGNCKLTAEPVPLQHEADHLQGRLIIDHPPQSS